MKNFDITSKREYQTPIIVIEELEKQDILTASDNVSGDAQEWFGDSGGISDLFNAILGNDY